MIKKLALILTISLSLFGYEKGDTIDTFITQKIGMEKEKIYIIDFFASWCHSCKKEIPLLSELNSALNRDKVSIIGIDVDESLKEGKLFQNSLKKEGKLNFKVINDPKGEIVKRFDPPGIPAVYIVKNKKVLTSIIGAKDDIKELIKKSLKEFL